MVSRSVCKVPIDIVDFSRCRGRVKKNWVLVQGKMMEMKEKKFLTVAPFECAWRKDLKFREAGRGCVAFEAFAHNDVTLVFRENVGSQHYHYKRDNSPHYTIILGSHRNKRLKIEVDGKPVVDVAGVGLCCSSAFQSYWISIYDGLISIGKGRYPFQNLVFQWLDSNPNCSVQYVGLSSWDKHVGYRNVNVLPLRHNHISLWKHVDCGELEVEEDAEEDLKNESTDYEKWGLANFLESWELSDMVFIVGTEERPVPAHKAILEASGNFPLSSSEDVVQLRDVNYTVLHALLQYIYTGRTQVLYFPRVSYTFFSRVSNTHNSYGSWNFVMELQILMVLVFVFAVDSRVTTWFLEGSGLTF